MHRLNPSSSTMPVNPNNTNTPAAAAKARTTCNSLTFQSTANPCLDFFFNILPKTLVSELNDLLEAAWNHDPLKTLKLVCNLRAVGGTGKSDQRGFLAAASWLYHNHPKTLASNVASFAQMGCFSDLLHILCRLLKESTRIDAKLSHKEKRIQKFVQQVFIRDPNFKFLHDCVSDVFAQYLRSDMKLFEFGDLGKISAAAKWCPSLGSKFDKSTLLWESIAKKVFPREEYPEYEGVEEAHYANRVMDRLREQVLLPLRKAAQLPEVYIKANNWGSLNYEKVPSEEMITLKTKFLMHDNRRFRKYLEKVKSGEAKLLGSGELLPHKIIEGLYDNDQVAELLWKKMVEEMPKLKNCLAICDVTPSVQKMSLALGVLVSELNQGPWKGKLITFDKNVKIHELVEGESLRKKMEFIKEEIERGNYEKNLQKVFDVLLEVAVKGKLRGEEMVKRVIVFSDMGFGNVMHFNSVFSDMGLLPPPPPRNNEDFETDYEKILRKFKENGYGDCVPEMVFWKLDKGYLLPVDSSQEGSATPVLGNQPRVALVSGYSKNLMSLFSEQNGAILDPEAVMEAAISGEEYQRLLLVD